MRIRFFSRCTLGALCGVSLAAFLWAGPSLAQTPPTGQPGAPPEAMKPPSENPIPPTTPGGESVDPNQPLTDQLKQGDGVLEPPRMVDPGLKQPVPDRFNSRTPVIKPEELEEDEDGETPPPPE